MKRVNRMLSLLLAMVMVFTMIPTTVFAASPEMTLRASQVSALSGSTVDVTLDLEGNPGLAAMKVKVAFDSEILTLTNVAFNEGMGGQYQMPQTMNSPVSLTWYNGAGNFTEANANFATLTFRVSETAYAGDVTELSVTYNPSDIYDITETDIALNVINGSVTILDCVPGDINGDGVANLKDQTRMFQYLADWEVEVNELVLDTNGDGSINLKDQTRLFQYLADWDVEIWPKPVKRHTLEAVEQKAATCTEAGNIAYWYCTDCGKYFTNETGTGEIAQEATVIAALGHTEETFSQPGYTDGVKCSVCGEILVEPTPITEEMRTITYDVGNGFSYIEDLVAKGLVGSANPEQIAASATHTLANPTVAGYKFLGWYDLPEGNAAENIKKLTPGDGIETLYAHWAPITYTVQYKSDLIPEEDDEYTVERGKVLAVPQLDGYTFAGWSDEDGNIVREIKAGETGHKIYTANWLSDRNQAWAKRSLEEPVVYEDDNVILFAYEIGEVRNVPLYEVHNFGKILSDGVTKTVEKSYSATTSTAMMETYAKAIAESTTESFSWTIGEGWSDSVTIDEEWLKENNMTKEEAEKICRNESENWYISSGSSGTDTTVELDYTDTYDLTTTTKNTKTYDTKDKETRQDFSAELGIDYTYKTGLKTPLVEAKSEHEFSAGLDVKYANGATTTKKTGTEDDEGSNEQDGTIKRSSTETTTSTSWNSESGTGGSKEVSQENAVTLALSEKISAKTGYGKAYIQSGDQSTTQDKVTNSSSNEEYASSVTFTKVEEKSVTETFTTENTKSGYHRWIIAGTAHVFGVVGYDIASESFFTYSFSIMDDKTYDYEDYSYNSPYYNDNQRSIIPFEAPSDIVDYVMDRVNGSDGLVVSKSGVIMEYNGNDPYVTVPEFISLDGNAIKVTGINEEAFQNKDMMAIKLSDYITCIPNNAFAGCTNLSSIEGKGITSIGDNAFTGCSELKYFVINEHISYLGTNVFDTATSVAVRTDNMDIVKAVIESGAKEIEIYIIDPDARFENVELIIPQGTEKFLLDGNEESFNNLRIVSHASETTISKMAINSDGPAPLDLYSKQVELREVSAEAVGIALICRGDATTLTLYGETELVSQTDNTMLCKALALGQKRADYYSHLTVNGNLLICDTAIENDVMLTVNGEIVPVSATQFDAFAKGVYSVVFDGNGGAINDSESVKTIVFGQKYGTLPTPTRDYYTFEGWYTEASGGTKVTEDSVFSATTPITLYAQWELNPLSDWVEATAIPNGADPVETRYSYTQEYYTTSGSSTMSGDWKHYDTTWEWSDYGVWSSWTSTYPNPGESDSREIQSEERTRWIDTSYWQHQYHYYHFCCTCGSTWLYTNSGIEHNGGKKHYNNGHDVWVNEELPFFRYSGGMNYYEGPRCGAGNSPYWFKADGTSNGNYHTFERDIYVEQGYNENYYVWRYRDRSKVYTYHFYRSERLTSQSYPSGANVVNIVEEVRYRMK